MGMTNRIQEMLIEQARQRRMPLTVNVELLPICNLNCKMCYIRTSREQVEKLGGLKSVDEWILLAEQMKKAGVLFLLLTGGEVFLYPEFRKLYIELYKMGFIITINTNATLINEETVDWLKCYPPKCISISLYGASDETYEVLCGAKGVFSKVDHAIQLLVQNRIRVEIKTMVTPLNVQDIPFCFRYASIRGLHFEPALYAFPPTRKLKKEEQVRFSAEETTYYQFACNRMMSKQESFDSEIVKHLQKYEDTRHNAGSDVYGFTCGACNSLCWITWQGKMTPCAMLNEPYTNPFECGFLAAWEELKQKCDVILMSPQCSHCDKREVCTVCPAANYAETGSFEMASPFHCKMTELTLDKMKQYVNEVGIDASFIRKEGEE